MPQGKVSNTVWEFYGPGGTVKVDYALSGAEGISAYYLILQWRAGPSSGVF